MKTIVNRKLRGHLQLSSLCYWPVAFSADRTLIPHGEFMAGMLKTACFCLEGNFYTSQNSQVQRRYQTGPRVQGSVSCTHDDLMVSGLSTADQTRRETWVIPQMFHQRMFVELGTGDPEANSARVFFLPRSRKQETAGLLSRMDGGCWGNKCSVGTRDWEGHFRGETEVV